MRPYQDISVSTKAAEGFFIGSKFGMIHALFWAPFVSKETSLLNKSSRTIEYLKSVSRASIFFCFVMSSLFGVKQYIYKHKDKYMHDLMATKTMNKPTADLLIYFVHSLPVGFLMNYWHTGRLLKGGLSYSLMFALVVRLTD